MNMTLVLIESLALALTVSADTFAAGFAYGAQKIKIPVKSAVVISVFSSVPVGVSLWAGDWVVRHVPGAVTSAVCFCLLFCFGMAKIFDSFTKSFIRRHSEISKEIKFSLCNFRFILSLCADPAAADADKSKVLSVAEASTLALALSLDGFAVGFGAALGHASPSLTFLLSIIIGALAIVLGEHIGNGAAIRTRFNLSWLSGVVLISIAVMNLAG